MTYYAIELTNDSKIVHRYSSATSTRTVCNMHLDDCAWFIANEDKLCAICYPSD